MKYNGFTLIEIMITVAIVALLSTLAIPNILRARINAQETLAISTLKHISTACEVFASANNALYPGNEAALTGATPPYLNQAYCGLNLQGYSYTCNFSVNAYTITSTPVNPGIAGNRTFTVTTGGIFSMS
ncbi:MAG: prepilin-type N-terminal cleavage/methylation domain-containing protein [Candidatus Omnitrophota bacterium]